MWELYRTRPWGRVQRGWEKMQLRVRIVSILTRPWGRVQLGLTETELSERKRVSILTRPWGRVQRPR